MHFTPSKSKVARHVLLLFALSLPSCMPTRNGTAVGGKPPTLNIVVAQPCRPETAEQVMAALRKSLSDAAASRGGFTATPEFRVLRASGELLPIHAQVSGGWGATFFGNTPATRKKQLEANLAALDKALIPDHNSKGVPPPAIKTASSTAFKTRDVVVWTAGNAGILWEEGEPVPGVTVITDEAVFEQHLLAEATKGGNYLIVTDPAANPAGPAEAAASAREDAQPSTAMPTPMPTPLAAIGNTRGHKSVGSAGNELPIVPPGNRGGDNIIIQMNPEKPGDSTVILPQGSELVGEPIFFAFNSDALNSRALETVRRNAATIKARGATRVILIASADSHGSTSASDRYASKRGVVVEAALMMEGIIVERRIEVGARLSVKGSSSIEQARNREVLIYVVPEPMLQKVATNKKGLP